MKVVFGDLEEMLSELEEKEIRDVRVEPLYDERYSKQGVAFLKVYVAVQALLPQQLHGPHEKITAYLYASYEKVTFRGIKPPVKEELQATFDRNLKAMRELKGHLKKKRFWVRGGHFEEE